MTKRLLALGIGFLLSVLALPAGALTASCPPLGCGSDVGWATAMETKIRQNMEDGQVFEIDKDPTTGAITSINHFGDSALWTGTYLAGESYRYALAQKYLATNLSVGDRQYWTSQLADAKPRIDAMVAKFHLLSNISKNWTNTDAPDISPPKVYLGGAVYKGGEAGNLMRACLPTDTPEAYRWSDAEIARSRRIYGPLRWDDGKEYYCEDGTSRDAYAGTFFGLLTAFDLVGPSDKHIADTIRDDVATMVGFALNHYWTTPRPNGRVSLPVPDDDHNSDNCKMVDQFADICGHDFENFVSPLFTISPAARINLVTSVDHVVNADPGRTDVAKWDAVKAEELAVNLPMLPGDMEVTDNQPAEGYYKFNLNHLVMFNITRLAANDPVLSLAFRQSFGIMDGTTRDDVNAHFEALTYALTGESSRMHDAVTHLRQWRDYYNNIHTTGSVNNSQYCGTTITCVYQDQLEFDENTPVATVPLVIPGGYSNTHLRAKDPLPVASRPPTDFLWQRPPWQLDGSESPNHYAPGIDYLLPYWVVRYYTEASVPALNPFPVWPGPAHN